VLDVKQTVVQFKDRERASEFFLFAWREFGNRRTTIREWLGDITGITSDEGQVRLSFALGLLAQEEFGDVFNQILQPWLLSDSKTQQAVADVALSVAAFDAAAAAALRNKIASWVENGGTSEVYASARLACGFAGARLPGIAIETLRGIASHPKRRLTVSLVETMQQAMQGLLAHHVDQADSSLFDLPGLMTELARWSLEGTSNRIHERELPNDPLPLLLFLLVMQDIPASAEGGGLGRLSLDSLTHLIHPPLENTLAGVA
jgi:hypothetical protein